MTVIQKKLFLAQISSVAGIGRFRSPREHLSATRVTGNRPQGTLTLCWQQPIYKDAMMRPSFRSDVEIRSGSPIVTMVQPTQPQLRTYLTRR